jgi:hypothetical protein
MRTPTPIGNFLESNREPAAPCSETTTTVVCLVLRARIIYSALCSDFQAEFEETNSALSISQNPEVHSSMSISQHCLVHKADEAELILADANVENSSRTSAQQKESLDSDAH